MRLWQQGDVISVAYTHSFTLSHPFNFFHFACVNFSALLLHIHLSMRSRRVYNVAKSKSNSFCVVSRLVYEFANSLLTPFYINLLIHCDAKSVWARFFCLCMCVQHIHYVNIWSKFLCSALIFFFIFFSIFCLSYSKW